MHENVRGEDVFILQSTSFPANDNLMELLIVTDALRRSSARRITAVLPYFGYARQDRKSAPRTPISAKLVANLITDAGANRVLDARSPRRADPGLLRYPDRQPRPAPVIVRDIQRATTTRPTPVIVSPDVGGVVRARNVAQRLGTDLAIVDKRRPKAGVSEVMNIIGDVAGHDCILIDDIVDSGGTLVNAAEALLKAGARNVSAYITHGVLCDTAPPSASRPASSRNWWSPTPIEVRPEVAAVANIRRMPIAPLIGEAIARTASEQSVSSLFDSNFWTTCRNRRSPRATSS